jgi:hypothetical protein
MDRCGQVVMASDMHQFMRQDAFDMFILQSLAEPVRPQHQRMKNAEYPWLHHVRGP